MQLRRRVMSMCLLRKDVLWQQLLFFAGFSIRRLQGRNGSFEILRDDGYRLIQVSQYSNCRPDSRAGQWSAPIFPDPESWEEIARPEPHADEQTRQRG